MCPTLMNNLIPLKGRKNHFPVDSKCRVTSISLTLTTTHIQPSYVPSRLKYVTHRFLKSNAQPGRHRMLENWAMGFCGVTH